MADTKGAAGIYIGQGYMPSAEHYDETETQWNSAQVSALVPNTVAQPYYVLVQAIALSGASSAFTLTAHALGFELDSFSPTTINNTGQVTLQINGGQLSAGLTYQITDSAGNVYTATSVNVVNSSLVDATFYLDGIPTGGFSVSVSDPQQDPSSGGGSIVSGDPGKAQTSVTVSPAEVKCGQSYTVDVKITNTGGSDVSLYNLKLSDGTSFGTITIAAGSTWEKSVNETAGQYPPGSSNSETWTLTDDEPEVTPTTLQFDTGTGGGVDVGYDVAGGPLAQATSLDLYWAPNSPSFNPGADTLAATITIPKGTGNGASSLIHETDSSFVAPPPMGVGGAGPYYLLAVTDRDNTLGDFNASTNVIALDVSPAVILTNSVTANTAGQQITATFKPAGGALTLQQAYNICGVNHFNWSQTITEPSDWLAYSGTTTAGTKEPLTHMDPVNYTYSDFSPYLPGVAATISADTGASGFSYLDESPAEWASYSPKIGGTKDPFTFQLIDAPSRPAGFFGSGESLQFVTTLIGVSAAGTSVSLFGGGISFNWHSNYTTPYRTLPGGGQATLDTVLGTWQPPVVVPVPPATVMHQTLGSATEKVVQSGDPNDMYAGGFGPQGWISGGQTIPYTIDFENMPTAAAPAAQVVITDQLSANLDWSTFQLQQIYFNDVEIQVPPDLQNYTTQVHVGTDPNPVDVTAAFNPDTGVVTWTMTSINPVTGQEVTDPLAGFLPPDNADFDGSGLVSYTVDPEPGLPSDTQITSQASIVFDVNAAMETPHTLNTVDITPPTSSVQALPAKESQASFTVSWSGQDLLPNNSQGAGIASYNVYVSEDGGPFTLWQSATTANSATFSGQFGDTYSFYTVAADNVGNVQPPPAAAQTTTYLVGLPTSTVQSLPATTTSTSFTVSWSGSPGVGATSIATYTIYDSDDGGPFMAFLTNTTLNSTTFTGQFGHTYGFYSVATDNLGDVQPTPSAAQAKITVVNTLPPPLVTVRSLQVETIKLGKGKKAKKETVLVLQFSGALNASAADNTGAYELAPVEKVKSTGKGKNKKPATSKLGKPVALASADFTASNNQVTLTPRGTLKLTKAEELIVDAALVTDTLGREIDGNDDGQPGGDFIATISGSRVTVGGLPLARTRPQASGVSAAIDALLVRVELTGLTHSPCARSEARLAAKAFNIHSST